MSRSIPREKPSFVFEVEAPLNSTPWLEKPVVDGTRVLVAGGGIAPRLETVTVLAAFDTRDGALLWKVDLDAEGRELFAGIPALLEDGRALLPIAEAKGGIVVELLVVDRDGRVADRIPQRSDEDGRREPTLQAVVAAAAPPDRCLVSWLGGPVWTRACTLADRALLWEAPEWLCGVSRESAILQRVTGDAELVARRTADGKIAWTATIEAPVVAHVSDAQVLVVDSHDRRAENAVADAEWDEHLGSRAPRPPDAPSDVTASPVALVSLDPETGRERWRRRLDAEVTSVAVAAHVVCAVAAQKGEARLYRFSRDGAPLGDSALPRAPAGRESDPNAWPALIAIDHTHVLWANKERLVCEVLADPGRVVWDLELPVPGRGFHVGPIEGALAERSIAVAVERIFLRSRNRLWSWSPDPA